MGEGLNKMGFLKNSKKLLFELSRLRFVSHCIRVNFMMLFYILPIFML